MKIIDLLNKIANGEEVPKVIYFWERPYYFDKEFECYMYQCEGNKFIDLLDNHNDNLNCFLNDEVEIIEEKEIPEKINQTLNRNDIGDDYYRYIMENRFTINKIIDYLKSEGE